MLTYDFEQSLGYWACSTAHVLRKALDAELATEGMTFRQWEVLALLSIHGEQTQKDLGDRMGLEAPTLGGIIDRMERDELLVRVPCPDDRRCKRIRVTEKAEKFWERGVACATAVRERARNGISDEQFAVFQDVCRIIRGNLCGERAVAEQASLCSEA